MKDYLKAPFLFWVPGLMGIAMMAAWWLTERPRVRVEATACACADVCLEKHSSKSNVSAATAEGQ